MYTHSKLKNGISLITIPMKGTMATTVLAMFPVGSRYETKLLSGASHFVEHMLFKGTTKRPTAQKISRAMDAVGAEYNAFTYKDYTGYYVKIDSKKQEIAFDLLSDMLYSSVIDSAEIEKEKGAIVEELRMYIDNPSMAIDILADKLVFGENQLGWDIGGSEESVRGMTREDLWQYYQRHYSAKNMVLVVAGNITRPSVKKLTQYFEGQKAPRSATSPAFYKTHYTKFTWPRDPCSFSERLAVQERTVDQAQIILNFPGLASTHADKYALSILLTILGGGMSSRLFEEVREKRGLAYMVRAGASCFRDTGLSYIQAGLDPKRMGEAVKVIKGEVEKIVAEKVTPQELLDAQNNISGRMALNMEDSSSQAEWYAKQFLFNTKVLTPEQVVIRLKKVTAADVQRVAKKLLVWDHMRMAVIGPFNKTIALELLA